MLDDLEGGGLDDLDDLLDDFERIGERAPPQERQYWTASEPQAKAVSSAVGAPGARIYEKTRPTAKPQGQAPARAEPAELALSERQTGGPNPSAGSGVEDPDQLLPAAPHGINQADKRLPGSRSHLHL